MHEHGCVAYQTVGQGELDVVFVPCWVSHLDHLWEEPRFVRFVERLAAFGRVVLFDKRGTGLSDPTLAGRPQTVEERLEDLRTVLDAAGSRRAVLVGVSAGSPLAARFAAAFPARTAALVMLGGAARRLRAPDYPLGISLEQFAGYLERVEREWGGPFDVEAFGPSLADDPRFRAWWAGYLRRAASPSAAVAAAKLCATTDVRDTLPRITVPTLVLHRSGDRVIPVGLGQDLAERIPGARFVELPGEDHIPFLGDQDALFAELDRFLADGGAVSRPTRRRTVATVVVAQLAAGGGRARGVASGGSASLVALEPAIAGDLARLEGRLASVAADRLVALVDSPAGAVALAGAILERAGSLRRRLTLGIHSGPVELAGAAVGGLAPSVAARIAAAARPGEIVVSRTVWQLVAGSGLTFEAIAGEELAGTTPSVGQLYRFVPEVATVAPAASVATPPRSVTGIPAVALSPREREVTALLATGLSNRQIAGRLAISVGTAERHVTNILTKLGVRSRAQVAAWAVEQRLAAERANFPVAALRPIEGMRPAA
jgi:pimeloyl-ACP methyl ester carboxylesterase/DNA-binding CsgD family transcriptional regulator